MFKAGRWNRSRGDGGGFAAGGVADRVPPGAVLAGLAGDLWQAGLGRLSDDELIGVLRAARRLASWATAMELAAVGDLWRRRTAEEDAGDKGAAEHVDDEIAAALTLTRRAANQTLDLAVALRRLPLTAAALAAGDIDRPRAKVIADEVTGLTSEHATSVDRFIADVAPGQTTGQLRVTTRRTALAVDPAAARRRKEQALREARVERWDEHSGTAALAGRDLPPVSVLAADHNLTLLAKQLKAAGLPGTLDSLRAQVYLALLTGAPVSSLLPSRQGSDSNSHSGSPSGRCPTDSASTDSTPADNTPAGDSPSTGCTTDSAPSHSPSSTSDGPDAGAGLAGTGLAGAGLAGTALGGAGWPGDGADSGVGGAAGLPLGVSGTVNLTVPLDTWLGLSEAPGHVAGFGYLDAADSRAVADALAARAGGKLCFTFTDPRGRAVAHGCARAVRCGCGRAGPAAGRRRTAQDTRADNRQASVGNGQARADDEQPRVRDGPGSGAHGGMWALEIAWLDGGGCDHRRETPGYLPSLALRHLMQIRHATCVFPGCRRPAAQCDVDHTVPYHLGGRTCSCNLAPLCRHHHEVKQARGWMLEHTSPGILTWTTPAGQRYTVTPTEYPGS